MSTFPRPGKHNGLDAQRIRPLPSDPARAQRRFQKLPEVYYHHSPYFSIPEQDKPLQTWNPANRGKQRPHLQAPQKTWDPDNRVKYRPPRSQEKIPYGPRGIAIAPYPGGRPYDVPAHIKPIYRGHHPMSLVTLPHGMEFRKAKSEYQHTYYHSVKEFGPPEICHAVEVEEPSLHVATLTQVECHSVEIVTQVDYSTVEEFETPELVPVEASDLIEPPVRQSPLKRYNETYIFVLRLLIIGKVDSDQDWSPSYNYILVAVVISLRSIVHLCITVLAFYVHSLVDFSPTS